MYYDGQSIMIETSDQCFTCEYFKKGVSCPLLEALGAGVVNLDPDSEVMVSNCGFYKPYVRHLRVVDPALNPQATSATESQPELETVVEFVPEWPPTDDNNNEGRTGRA